MQSVIQLAIESQLLVIPELKVRYGAHETIIPNAIIDTGSAGTLLDADLVADIGVTVATALDIRKISGIGGEERVYEHEITLQVGDTILEGFLAEIGNMQQYGAGALIGLDWLMATKSKIDLETLMLIVSDS